MRGTQFRKLLGKSERPVAPVIWELDAASLADPACPELFNRACQLGGDWFLLPHFLPLSELQRLHSLLPKTPRAHVVLGLSTYMLHPDETPAIARFDAISELRVEAAMVQAAMPSELHDGEILSRLQTLGEARNCELIFLEALDLGDAEWMVENTTANAISLPFGLNDQTASYRVIHAGDELSIGMLARRPPQPVWPVNPRPSRGTDLGFVIAHPAIGGCIERFPDSAEELDLVMQALSRPMPELTRDLCWSRFMDHVPEPPRQRIYAPPAA